MGERIGTASFGSRIIWRHRWPGSVGYTVAVGPDGPDVTLYYHRGDEEDIRLPIRLQATRPALGGRRWWFTCPLIADGVPCCRRVGKLYLPPGGRYFGCRHCHRLAYRSLQEAHQTERAFAVLGFDRGTLTGNLRPRRPLAFRWSTTRLIVGWRP